MEMPNKPPKNIFNRLGSKKPSREDERNNENNNISSDLKTFCAYSRMITCEKSTVSSSSTSSSSCTSSNPFYNLKIEIVNNSTPKRHKRRLDDSCLDDTYETPFKRFCRTNVVSPDLGCVLDSCNSFPDIATASSTTDIQEIPSSVNNAVKWDSEASVREPSSGHVQIVPAKEVGSKHGGTASPSCPFSNQSGTWSESTRLEPDNIPMDLGPVFDFDVDKIMCLSPFDSDRGSDEDIEHIINIRNSFYNKHCASNGSHGDVYQSKPLLAPNQTQDQVKGKKTGEQMVGKAEQKKDELNQQGEALSGEIYFSTTLLEALRSGVRHTAMPLQPHTEPSPVVRECETQGPHVVLGEGQPQCPAGLHQNSMGLAVPCQLNQSFIQDVGCYGLFGASLNPVEGSDADFEVDAQKVWYIGAPILESSMCYNVPVKSNAVCVGQMVSEERDLDTVATSYKTALPLNVQETSALPGVQTHSKKTLKLPGQNASDARGVQEPLEKNVVKKTSPVLRTSSRKNVVKNITVQEPSTQQNNVKTTPIQKVSPPQKVIKGKPAQASSKSSDQKVLNVKTVQASSKSSDQRVLNVKPAQASSKSSDQKVLNVKPVQASSKSSHQKVLNVKTVQASSKSSDQEVLNVKTVQASSKSSDQKVLNVKTVQASSKSSDQKLVKTRHVQHTVPRPVVYDREEYWQREKRLYVDSVTRHMRENTGTGGSMGVMTELMNLMNHVAHQVPGANRRQWQHPSDLTRRNYQKRFGNESAIYTLDEWQNRNDKKYCRFAKVPLVFERSPV
ncbi:hypothetical protein UPYG_G00224190 [Umbra pygmaea]|uniref:S100P-binding protein n=1 Tax=Umbra pygmaea TaxID=75934 RepID=A0ABD0WH65_UMBPY